MNVTVRNLLVLVTGAAVIAGCAAVRKVTYPPDFVYLEGSEVTSAMSRLSADVWRIDDILKNSETVLPYEREEIIDILNDMERVANRLGAGTVETNHPFIDQNIDAFKRDVELALEEVKQEPPSYYKAGRISGRCLACHRLRG